MNHIHIANCIHRLWFYRHNLINRLIITEIDIGKYGWSHIALFCFNQNYVIVELIFLLTNVIGHFVLPTIWFIPTSLSHWNNYSLSIIQNHLNPLANITRTLLFCIFRCTCIWPFFVLGSQPWKDWLLWNNCVTNDYGYVPRIVSTSRSFPHSWLIIEYVTRLTQRVTLVEQELLTFPELLSSPPVFGGVCVTWSLVLCVCFVDRCLSICPFTFCHCVVCPSSICGILLYLWYL